MHATQNAVEFLVNGRAIRDDTCTPSTTLLDVLRSNGLTGAKEGCAEGECGACTVVLMSGDATGSSYRAVNSCLMLLPMAAGQEIYTVEALAPDGPLSEVQQSLAEAGGSQCGYCTPGFVMSLFAEQYRKDRVGPCDPHQLGGNLCRCTGYRPIRDAALSLGPAPPGVFRDRLAQATPPLPAVTHECEGTRFSRPTSLAECLSILAADPDARPVAGGTDMVVETNLRGRQWRHLVSLEAIAELQGFSESAGSVTIGAALPLSDLGACWTTAPQAVREWLPLFASPTIRNRATLGGNLATASPIGDAAPLLLALDAVAHIAGAGGRYSIPLASFFTGYRRTVLRPGEILAAVEIPKPFPEHARFYKVAKRRMDDISTVAVCLAMDWDGDGRIKRARFAFGGVAAVPLRVTEAENALPGQRWNQAAVARVQAILDKTLHPIGDHRGSAEYRLGVSKSLIEKFWWEREEALA